jgi:hypothetical protein
MSHRLLLTSVLATSLATVAIGCVDLNQADGCVSDDECRYGRTCSALTGQCVGPETTPGTIGDDDAEPDDDDADAGPAPDAVPDPDVAPPVVPPAPDSGPDEPDVPGTPDVGTPDGGTPDAVPSDAEACSVVAHARVKLAGGNQWHDDLSAPLLEAVEFDASSSGGGIAGYEWSILERPAGSTQSLLPDTTSANPTLFVEMLGLYRVQLTAIGETASGATCRDTDIVTVTAETTDDLHIQLTWDTPGDPDQTDSDGADLDLHYLHPNGRFGQPPWDIFWPNPTSDWGVQGDATDDPRLDIDDTDGAGPEYVSHSGLEIVDYAIGVQLNNHRDFGPSFATVRIYHLGQLIFELEDQRIAELGAFWHVAKINGNGTVVSIDTMHDGYPSL